MPSCPAGEPSLVITSSSMRTSAESLRPKPYARASPAARRVIAGALPAGAAPIECQLQPPSEEARSSCLEPASRAPGLPSATSPQVYVTGTII